MPNRSRRDERSADLSISKLRSGLARKIARFVGTSERMTTAIPGLMLVRRTAPSAPCSCTYEPSLIVIAQGRKRVSLGQSSLDYGKSRFLLTTIDLPTVSQIVRASEAEPLLGLKLQIDISLVREVLSRDEVQVPDVPAGSPGMITGEITSELLAACSRLVDLVGAPRDIPFMSGLIQREIIYRLLCGPEGVRLRAVATSGDQSHRTAKAIAWIRDHYAAPVRVDDLAHLAGMGVSTLHHHFRTLTKMSPLQYQKQLRLQTARERMLINGVDASTVALEVGYESVSQFNREYSRLFGQPPMRDVRHLRTLGTTVGSEV